MYFQFYADNSYLKTLDDLFPQPPSYDSIMPLHTDVAMKPSETTTKQDSGQRLNSLLPIFESLRDDIMTTNSWRELDIAPGHAIMPQHLDKILKAVVKVRELIWRNNRDVSYLAIKEVIDTTAKSWPLALPLFPALEKLDFDDLESRWMLLSRLFIGTAICELRYRMSAEEGPNRELLDSLVPDLWKANLKKLELEYPDGQACPLRMSSDQPLSGDADEILICLPASLEELKYPFFIGTRGLSTLARLPNIRTLSVRMRDEDMVIDDYTLHSVFNRGFIRLEELVLHLQWGLEALNTVRFLHSLGLVKLRTLRLVVPYAVAPWRDNMGTALDHVIRVVTHGPWAASLESLSITSPTPDEGLALGTPIIPPLLIAGSYIPELKNLTCLKIPLDLVPMRGEELLTALDMVTQALWHIHDLDLLPVKIIPSQPLLPIRALHIIGRNCVNLQSLTVDVSGIAPFAEVWADRQCGLIHNYVKTLKVGCGLVDEPARTETYILKHFPEIEQVTSSWEIVIEDEKDMGWEEVQYIIQDRIRARRF